MLLTTALTEITIIVSLAIAMSSLVVLVFPSEQQQEAVGQQDNNNISRTNTTTPTTTTQSIMPASSNKTFYVFSAEVEGLNETTARIAGDIFTPPIIVVNRGDSVTVNLYNTEQETEERHSFTIDVQPYSVDIDIAGGESGNATFTVATDQEGIFPYYCKYHLPTMVGQLVVLPPMTLPEQQQQQQQVEEQPETTATAEEEQLPTTEDEEAEEQQQQQPLTVTTDRESYSTSDRIVITGTVAERQPGSRVSITVLDPQNDIVWRESVIVTANNTYQLEIEAGERQYGISPYAIDTSGTYLVTASYRAARAEATFEFTSEEGG
jgi:plastocyanin